MADLTVVSDNSCPTLGGYSGQCSSLRNAICWAPLIVGTATAGHPDNENDRPRQGHEVNEDPPARTPNVVQSSNRNRDVRDDDGKDIGSIQVDKEVNYLAQDRQNRSGDDIEEKEHPIVPAGRSF